MPISPPPKPLRDVARVVAGPILGIVAGLLVAFVLIIAVEFASAVVHPLPPDFAGTQEEMCAHVARYPAWVLALVVPAWALTAFAGTWTAGRIAGRNYASPLGEDLGEGALGESATRHRAGCLVVSGRGNFAALFVGLLLTAGVLFNVSMLPYPIWFKIASPIAVVAAVLAASRPR